MVVVAQGAAALAVSRGIGRFVYTPILPLMLREAGRSNSFGASLATANCAGYLLGPAGRHSSLRPWSARPE
jgi:uncharacterized MFS-type transporter YbfB